MAYVPRRLNLKTLTNSSTNDSTNSPNSLPNVKLRSVEAVNVDNTEGQHELQGEHSRMVKVVRWMMNELQLLNFELSRQGLHCQR